MHKLFVSVVAIGIVAAPAVAQDAQPAQPASGQSQVAPAAKPKTVTKTVCKRVEEERSIGSRLSSTTKICRTVEVPAPQTAQQSSRDGSTR